MTCSITTLIIKGLFVTLSISDTENNSRILFIIMPIVVMLSVVMLNVAAPTKIFKYLEVTDIIVERAVFKR
jgi:hypothetical protein